MDVRRFEHTRRVLEHELERRVERRVVPKARELAEKMYSERSFRVLEGAGSDPDDEETETPAETVEAPQIVSQRVLGTLPPGLTPEDVRRGWPEAERSSIRWRPRTTPRRIG